MSSDCIFCKIIKGDIPSNKIYEDENGFAFLDIGPVNPGHTLIIPKKHYENIQDMPPEELGKLIVVVQRVGRAVMKGTEVDGYNLNLSNGAVAGQEVPHLHFHIIPRYIGDGHKFWKQESYGEGEAEKMAAKIKNAI